MSDPRPREGSAHPGRYSEAFSLPFTPLSGPMGAPLPGDIPARVKPRPQSPAADALPLPGLDVWSLDSRRKSIRGAWRFWSLNSRVPVR